MKKILVFGGSGFLGSHVADALTDRGFDVTIYDMKKSPYLKKGQKMVVGDILDEKLVNKAVSGADIVYNFAGIADLDEARTKPIDTVKNNILGNTVILEAARKNNVKRYVFASSIYVYSNFGSFYRSSKHACELIIENYQEVYGLKYTILRYGSLYGTRADESNAIHDMLKQAVLKNKIVREGDGEDIREYINVEDAARFSVDILDKEYENQFVLIAGHQQIRVKDLLIMINEILGNKIDIKYVPCKDSSHYKITPYSFNPKIGIKIVSKRYLDFGQGILNCLEEIHRKYYDQSKNIKKIEAGV